MKPSPVSGLVLAGGRSTRMGKDKASLRYHGDRSQSDVALDLLTGCCQGAYLSCRSGQSDSEGFSGKPCIEDIAPDLGPAAGIQSAFAQHPDHAWLVLACDLPFLSSAVLEHLLANRNPASPATAYRSARQNGLPEPLCAIYEPAFIPILADYIAHDIRCPRKMLIQNPTHLIDLPPGCDTALDNANTPEDFRMAKSKLSNNPR